MKGIIMRSKKRPAVSVAGKKCAPCEGGTAPLTPGEIAKLLKLVPEWRVDTDVLTRDFEFLNFHQTMSFVNAVAWLANLENHHPDMRVGYSRVRVDFSTHAINGLSSNDFICAAKIDAMLAL